MFAVVTVNVTVAPSFTVLAGVIAMEAVWAGVFHTPSDPTHVDAPSSSETFTYLVMVSSVLLVRLYAALVSAGETALVQAEFVCHS